MYPITKCSSVIYKKKSLKETDCYHFPDLYIAKKRASKNITALIELPIFAGLDTFNFLKTPSWYRWTRSELMSVDPSSADRHYIHARNNVRYVRINKCVGWMLLNDR
jgi:hypothetical protein